ncbi:hypothetical protein JOM56_012253 [Amanita muscaria]
MFRLVSVLLLLHSLLVLNTLLRAPSPNVFSALKIPINTPTHVIRAALVQISATTDWLDRLDSFELRSLYVRFGHNVVLTCDHCQTTGDYALYALPRPALAYIREMALVGLVTLEKLNRSHLRSVGVGVLVAAFVAEAYFLGTAPIAVPPPGTRIAPEDTFMWHDQLLFYRHLLFLTLPLTLFTLPSLLKYITRSPVLFPIFIRMPFISLLIQPPLQHQLASSLGQDELSPAQLKSFLIQSCLKTLEHLVPSLHLQKLTHAALMRDSDLKSRAGEWWAREKEESDVILGDEAVKRAAKAEGLGFEEEKEKERGVGVDMDRAEGNLRTSARAAVDGLFNQGLRPSEHWVQMFQQ